MGGKCGGMIAVRGSGKMNLNESRRRLLKLIGGTTALNSGIFGVSSTRQESIDQNNEPNPHDLIVKNNGRSGNALRVEIREKEESRRVVYKSGFEIPPLNGRPDDKGKPPVETSKVDIDKGVYKLIIADRNGNRHSKDIRISAGGISPNEVIIVSKLPNGRFSISHAVA